jgi:hypothetical protein
MFLPSFAFQCSSTVLPSFCSLLKPVCNVIVTMISLSKTKISKGTIRCPLSPRIFLIMATSSHHQELLQDKLKTLNELLQEPSNSRDDPPGVTMPDDDGYVTSSSKIFALASKILILSLADIS